MQSYLLWSPLVNKGTTECGFISQKIRTWTKNIPAPVTELNTEPEYSHFARNYLNIKLTATALLLLFRKVGCNVLTSYIPFSVIRVVNKEWSHSFVLCLIVCNSWCYTVHYDNNNKLRKKTTNTLTCFLKLGLHFFLMSLINNSLITGRGLVQTTVRWERGNYLLF